MDENCAHGSCKCNVEQGQGFLEVMKVIAVIIAQMQGQRDRTTVVADTRIVGKSRKRRILVRIHQSMAPAHMR